MRQGFARCVGARALVLVLLLPVPAPQAWAQDRPATQSPARKPAGAARLVVLGDRSLPPYEFLEDGVPKGLNVDLFREIARVMGRPIEVQLGDWAKAHEEVLAGAGQMLPPVVRTPERAQHFDFTQSIWSVDFSLFARAEEVARISRSNPADLRIGVAAARYPEHHFGTTYPATQLVVVADEAEGMRRLLRGDFDAFAGITLAGRVFLKELGITGIAEVGEPFASLDVSIAVRKGNPALLAQLDRAIGQIKSDGRFDRLLDLWSGPRAVLTLTHRDLWFSAAAGGAALLVSILLTMFMMQRRRSLVLAAELERRARAERQLEFARREAEAARIAAEAANRAKGEFLANMSHEIRTPMNAIVGLTRMLRRGTNSPERTQDRLRKIDDAAQHLLSLVSDVLDLAKIDAGRLVLDRAEFSIATLVQSAVSHIAGQAEQKGLHVLVEAGNADETFVGDPMRLRQALVNLASNAVKFTARGQVAIRGRKVEETHEAVLLRFEVEDTGIGIAPELRERIFEVFEQASASTTREYGGTGLGLSITRRLVGLMGGTIGVASEPGVGSRFWFTVRVAPGRSVAPQPAVHGSDPRAVQSLREGFAGARVLVVEDNEVNLEVTTALLTDAGLVAVPARNGAEAVDMARRDRFALILMDMQMPVLDGMAAASRIREFRRADETPILALTANAFDEDRRACSEAGMNAFVAKPVDPDTLYETVLLWLQRRKPPEEQEKPAEPASAAFREPAPQGLLDRLMRVENLDVEEGLRNCGGRESQFVNLLRLFADDAERSLGLLEQQGAAAEPRTVLNEAHRVRGGAAAVGADGLRDRLHALEDALRREAIAREALPGTLRELAGAARRFSAQLRAALREGS